MELEELITIWKKQDQHIDHQLQQVAFKHLLQYQSEGVLDKIKRHLQGELLVISFVVLGFNGLFFLIDLPFTALRWIGFTVFNLIALMYWYRYWKVISSLQYSPSLDLRATLRKIIDSLRRFRGQSKYFNLPIGVIGILMFSVTQHLFSILPWLIGEFLLWKWVLTPRMNARFEWYLVDLEYTFKCLNEL